MRKAGNVQPRPKEGSDTVLICQFCSMGDFLDQLKRKHWKEWFKEPIPMLHDMTPRQAAQTARGRELLDELFAFMDRARSDIRSFDVNFPTRWAKWKLGYGPGSPEEFRRGGSHLRF